MKADKKKNKESSKDKKYNKPLHLNMTFEEAIKRLVRVKPKKQKK